LKKDINKGKSKLFEELFSEEIMSNESFRSKILAGIMGFVIIAVLLVSLVYKNHFGNTSHFRIMLEITLIISIIILTRSLFVSRGAKKWNQYGVKTFIFIRYINAFIEISLPSAALIIYSFNLPSVYPLFTPIALLYFLIIMLSALELDFKLCVFSGTMAALQYSIIVWFLLNKPVDNDIFLGTTFYPVYLGIAAFLFISGHTAGLITNQIKKGLLKHYNAQSERDEMQRLFGQQISKEIVDELVENKYEVKSRARFATIMFLDIRNFSIFAQNKLPEEIIAYQNSIFSFIIEIINKHKGIVNQITGDGMMAIFGAPIQHDNDCQLAVNAAIEIQNELEERIKNKFIPDTQIGIGIHAGDVITGNVGTNERKQYSITGQAVIIAARLEQLNKKLNSSLLISKQVYENIRLEELKPTTYANITIKGHSEPIDIYQLL
jgi:adenylate cyclase